MRNSEMPSIREEAGEELAGYLERLIMWKLPLSGEDRLPQVLEDCVRKLKKRQLQAEKQAVAAQIAALQAGDQDGSGQISDTSRELQWLIERDIEISRLLHAKDREVRSSPAGSGV
jgi:hypothetical protein